MGNQILFLEIEGKGAESLYQEAGLHRIQRVPPTEKRGRTHSSTVSVAVLDTSKVIKSDYQKVSDDDFSIEWFNGTIKAGGQFRNKTATSCRLTHTPTGLIKTAQSRSRENSQRLAKEAILKELEKQDEKNTRDYFNTKRIEQVGASSGRGERKRMWAFQRGMVDDFDSGKSIKINQAMRGEISKLWK